jgi:hypothetical protein
MAASSIGVVKSYGNFRVDGSVIQGNCTLFDGSVIETTSTRSVVQIFGANMTLLPDSRAQVYRDHTVLEKGSGILTHAQHLTVEAASLRIAPSADDSIVQVEKTGQTQVVVATKGGSAEVRDASGLLIADLNPNMALAFDTQASNATGAVKLTGVVQSDNGKYSLTDSTTGVKMALRGKGFASYAGKKVALEGSIIPGAAVAAGASQVVQVVTVGLVKAAAASAIGGGGALSAAKPATYIGRVSVIACENSGPPEGGHGGPPEGGHGGPPEGGHGGPPGGPPGVPPGPPPGRPPTSCR